MAQQHRTASCSIVQHRSIVQRSSIAAAACSISSIAGEMQGGHALRCALFHNWPRLRQGRARLGFDEQAVLMKPPCCSSELRGRSGTSALGRRSSRGSGGRAGGLGDTQ
jgi:hypothetical protein